MKITESQPITLVLAAAVTLGCLGCRAIRSIRKNEGSLAARRMSRQGMQAMRDGRWNTAEKLFSEALAESEFDDRAHRGLAESLWQRNQRDAAIDHMEHAIRLSAGEPKLIERLGRMYLDVGRLDDAYAQSVKALQGNRYSAAAWALRGDCLFQQGQLDGSLAAYHRALAIQPDYAEVQLQAAEIYRSQGRYDRVIATLDRMQENIIADSIPSRALMLRGIAMQKLSRGQEAMQCFQRAINRDPKSAEPHLMIASLCLEENDLKAARSAVQQAARLDPKAVQEGRWNEQLEYHQQRLLRR